MKLWALTTAIDTGDLESNDITHVRILKVEIDEASDVALVSISFGWVSGSTFNALTSSPSAYPTPATLNGTDYDDLENNTEDSVLSRAFTIMAAAGEIPAGSIVTV